jgi:transposase
MEPLCPSPAFWRIALIAPDDDRILIYLEPTRPEVGCPLCGTPSGRVHSRYRRRAWDLPWSRWPIELNVQVRRFFCDNESCPRRIFVEPFPEVLARHARRTQRARDALLELAHASSAERAALVARLLGFIVSPDTLIRWQRDEEFAFPSPCFLGVDEFALRRGRTYGTILVDLLRRQPVDLLGDKNANSLAAWLKEHPEVAVLARDRDDSYAQAGRLAIPDAVQVADRFHLVRNVGDALRVLLHSRRWAVPEDEETASALRQVESVAQELADVQKERGPTPLKQAHWQAVQEAGRQGLSLAAIARKVGIHRKTVRKYLQAEGPTVYRRQRSRITKLGPHLDYLRRRWEEGCRNASQLYCELLARGYTGGAVQVRRAVQPWRRTSRPPPVVRAPPLGWLLLPAAERLSEADRERLKRHLDANPLLAVGYGLKERFLEIVRDKCIEGLDSWLAEAEDSGLATFRSLATGLRRDYEPVRRAILLPWSTGPCEGHICRVKLIKRIGYGRAKPDLLRKRVLHRPAAVS